MANNKNKGGNKGSNQPNNTANQNSATVKTKEQNVEKTEKVEEQVKVEPAASAENKEQQNLNNQEQQQVKTKQTVVLIISKEDSAEIVELSLAAWKKNLPDCEIYLANGKFNELPVIEHEPNTDENINFANILAACVAEENVCDKFIVSPVSTFPVQISLEGIDLLVHTKKDFCGQQISICSELSRVSVVEALKKEGITEVKNFETGMPVVFEKELLGVAFEKFNPQKAPLKFITLYLNFFNQGKESVPTDYVDKHATAVWRRQPRLEIVKRGLGISKYFMLNNDGYLAVGKIIEQIVFAK